MSDLYPYDCTGATDCPALLHVHGCFADIRPARCNEPNEHGSRLLATPSEPTPREK